jgi:hypothetical protein
MSLTFKLQYNPHNENLEPKAKIRISDVKQRVSKEREILARK